MKIVPQFVIMVCLSILTCHLAYGQNTNKISGTIGYENVPVSEVLDCYKALTKQELVISTEVRRASHGITLHAKVVSVEATRLLLEQALLKQAGVVLTRLDDHRVSVTYNDHLELQP
jgi:hypothetical protein